MTLDEIAAATGGELVGDAAAEVDGFTVDSRRLTAGAMFVAVRGARDGNQFVADAVDRGAAAALVDRPPDLATVPYVRVRDTTTALADLASVARDRIADALVIAITGSTGKTTTKDLLAGALARRYKTVASPDSFNNELGVPLTLLAADRDTEAVVAEIGARGPGQIAALARVVRHRIGVVTTVGAAHTELFGALDGVAGAKAELLETLPRDGVAIVGTGHSFVAFLTSRSAAPVVTVGENVDDEVRFSDVTTDEDLRPRFRLDTPWGQARVRLALRGAHQASNAALAVAAAVTAGVALDEAVAGVADVEGSAWRMHVARTPAGVTVINDAYNANPASTAAALEALTALHTRGRRWAVLGPMAELGNMAGAEHRRVGEHAVALGIDVVVVVAAGGGPAAEITIGAKEAVLAGQAGSVEVVEVEDADAALRHLRAELQPGDAVLVKASRAAGLEGVGDELLRVGGRP